MKVVFLQDVTGSGRAGEVKEVADGYARNYLLPRNLAERATSSALKQAEAKIQRWVRQRESELAEASKTAEQLDGLRIGRARRRRLRAGGPAPPQQNCQRHAERHAPRPTPAPAVELSDHCVGSSQTLNCMVDDAMPPRMPPPRMITRGCGFLICATL